MYLDERLHSEIVKLSDEGNALCETKEYQRGENSFDYKRKSFFDYQTSLQIGSIV